MIAHRRKLITAVGLSVVLALGLVVWLASHRTSSAPNRAAPVPSQLPGAIDLAGWKLTLPDANAKGGAATLNPAAATPPWLTRDGDGGLTFWAPVKGATTEHSTHPRTELDSLTGFTAGNSGSHSLQATLAVAQVPPDTKDIIVGQIHGSDAISSIAFVMLHYQDGGIHAVVKQKLERGGPALQDYPLIDRVALGQRFDFTITDNGDGSMVFSASSSGVTKQATAPVPAAFAGQPVRFQIGDYQQSNEDPTGNGPGGGKVRSSDTGGSGDGAGGRVTFYQIDAQ